MKKFLYYTSFIWVLILDSCMFSEENIQGNVIQIEDQIYLSSNKVRLLGRVVESESSISDHGFYVADNEEFNNPVILSLGSKDNAGLYFAEVDSLAQTSTYFYKAYFSNAESLFFSDISLFRTFEGQINTVSRTIGKEGEITKLQGRNITNDLSVSFGDTPAEITEEFGDYEVWVKVPKVLEGYKQPIVVSMEGIQYTVDTFYYETGKWTSLASLNVEPYFKPVKFQDNTTFSFTLGSYKNETSNSLMHTLDLQTFQWTTTEVPPEIVSVEGAFSTASGYFGGGSSSRISDGVSLIYQLENGFSKYENGVFTTLEPIPFRSYASLATEYNEAVYVFGGRNKFYLHIDIFYKYENGVWIDMGSLPFDYDVTTPSYSFDTEILFTNDKEEVWSFDFLSESFTRKNEFPLKISNDGIAQVVKDQLVFGLFNLSNLINSTDQEGIIQLGKETFPGDRNLKNIADFKVNDAIYILRGSRADDGVNEMEFWKFEPFEFTN